MSYTILITNLNPQIKNKVIHLFKNSKLNIQLKITEEKIYDLRRINKVYTDLDIIINQLTNFKEQKLKKQNKEQIIINNYLDFDNDESCKGNKKNNNIIRNNIAPYCSNEYAEHTLAMYLSLIRKINYVKNLVNISGEWNYKLAGSIKKLSNMNLGLLGYSVFSKKIISKSLSLGFNKIIVHDINVKNKNEFNEIEFMEYENLLSKSDILLLTPPINNNSYRSINKNTINLIKEDSYIVNTFKEDLLEEEVILKSLKSGKIMGAALDVLSLKNNAVLCSELFDLPNVIMTPRLSWYSDEVTLKILSHNINQIIKHINS